jgi:serine/threonine-protein phosphatase 2B catalytic subunit
MEPLKDPKSDRVVKTVPLPPHRPLSSELLFGGKPINWELLRDHLKKEGRVQLDDILKILDMASEILSKDRSM